MRISSTLSSHVLKISRDGDSTISLGLLFQWLVVLTVKKIISCIKMNPFLVPHLPFALCLLHVVSCEEAASVFSVAVL